MTDPQNPAIDAEAPPAPGASGNGWQADDAAELESRAAPSRRASRRARAAARRRRAAADAEAATPVAGTAGGDPAERAAEAGEHPGAAGASPAAAEPGVGTGPGAGRGESVVGEFVGLVHAGGFAPRMPPADAEPSGAAEGAVPGPSGIEPSGGPGGAVAGAAAEPGVEVSGGPGGAVAGAAAEPGVEVPGAPEAGVPAAAVSSGAAGAGAEPLAGGTPSPLGPEAPAPQPAVPALDPVLLPEAAEVPARDWSRRVARRRKKLRRRRRLVVAAMVVLVGLGAGLVVAGLERVRSSTAGTYVGATLGPDEPGYVALVTPTPTMLVLQRDQSDQLAGIALLALRPEGEGGSVLLIPVGLQAPFADAGTDLRQVFADGGADTVRTQLELALNLAIGETVELDAGGWASLIDPIGSISMVLDAPVGEWPAGQIDVPASDVGRFLAARGDDESELARVDRQELFWDEWLPRVAAEGDDAVPGESDVGLGRFVRGLASGTPSVVALPVAEVETTPTELFEPNEELATEVVANEVPYPQEPSVGSRVRIRLLNGTSQPDLGVLAARPLVEAGAEIALSGNAASFNESRTRFIYEKSRLRDEANSLRHALGAGVIEQAPQEDTVEPADDADRIDVTVVLGADALEVIRRLESTG